MKNKFIYLFLSIFCLSIIISCFGNKQYDEESIVDTLNAFYGKYVKLKCSLIIRDPKLDSLITAYCTTNFLRTMVKSEGEYDPFLQVKDFNSILMNTIKINKEGASENSFLVSFKLKNGEESIIRLIVKNNEEVYQIDSVCCLNNKEVDDCFNDSLKLIDKKFSMISLGKYVNHVGCNINIFIEDSSKYIIEVNDTIFDCGKYEISPTENEKMFYIIFKNIDGLYYKNRITIQNEGNAMNPYTHFSDCGEKCLFFVKD